MPAADIASALKFYTKTDLEKKYIYGYAGHQDNTFSLDINNDFFSMRGEQFPLPSDAAFVQEFGLGLGDIYVSMDILNRLWGARFVLDYSNLSLRVETPRLLPFESEDLREERQQGFLASLEEGKEEYNFQIVPNEYKFIGKPAVNLTSQTRWDSNNSRFSELISASGASDLLWANANYNAQLRYDNEDSFDLRNTRLTLTRRADLGNELPLGLKMVQAGDISVKPPELIDKNSNGTGIIISNKRFKRPTSFDVITVEGTGQPGWDVEVFNGNQLEDFGVIDAEGVYRFEGVELSYGRNIIKTILYGPQGEIEERVEEYDIANTYLSLIHISDPTRPKNIS